MTDNFDPLTRALTTKSELPKIVNKLFSGKTPTKFIKSRPGPAGKVIKYVEIGYVTNELNKAFGPFWEFRVIDKQIGKKQVWIQGQLTVKDPQSGFAITKETFGGADVKISKATGEPIDIANDLKAAVSDCTKKCASMFGIAADVFFKEQDQYDQMETVIDTDSGENESLQKMALSKLFAMLPERGISEEQLKEYAYKKFNVESLTQLSANELSKLIMAIEKKPMKEKEVVDVIQEPEKPASKVRYWCQGKTHDPEHRPETNMENPWCSDECREGYFANHLERSKDKINALITKSKHI